MTGTHGGGGDRNDAAALRLRVADLEAALAAAGEETLPFAGFDDLFEGIQILDFEYRYLYVNRTASVHNRREREAQIGRRITEEYPGIEKTAVFACLSECMTTRTPRAIVTEFTFPDGHRGWFDVRVNPVRQGILILSVDITRAKQEEEDLRRSREDLSLTLSCMAEGVIATDVQGRVTRMNPAAQRLTGWTEREAIGRPLDELVSFLDQSTREPIRNAVERVLRDGTRIGLANDTVIVARDGTAIPVASSGAPLRSARGELRGAVIVLKNMKDEHELAAMLQRAQRMEALGTLAGGVAHDFNNLLTVITGYSDLLLASTALDGRSRGLLEQIRAAGERAASLTRQLLTFSRRQVLDLRVLDLNAVIGATEVMLRRVLGEDIVLSTTLDPAAGPVRADAGRIEQVVLNLATNARDAMPQGGRLAIETAAVTVDDATARDHLGVPPGRWVRLTVADTGCGMDAATLAHAFEPFFTTKGPTRGTGLGLSTVFGIVQQSGGHIRVESEPGRGATFRIYLPEVAGQVAAADAAAGPEPARGTETVLLVEDDEAVRAVAVAGLEEFGYTVLAAADGAAALRLCEGSERPIHLLITDVVMPHMGGRAVAGAVAARRPGIATLFISGYTDDAVLRHGIEQDRVAFLQKPFSPAALARKVREILDRPAADDRSRE